MSSGDSKRQAKRPYVLQFCNINSIRNKTPQLRSSLLFSKYSAFLSFVETHLGKDDQPPKLPGFVAHPFNHTNRSSGICFYSANDIACKPVCHPPVCVDGNMCVTMQIKLRGIAINVCSVYLKPAVSTVIAEQVLAPLRLLADSGKPLLLLGDFNAHHPQLGETKSMGKSNSVGRLIVDLAEELSLTILNTRDAWGTPTRGDSVLDLALTNNPDMFSLRIDAMPFLSDHSSLTIFFHPSDAEEQPQAPASSPLPPRWDVNKADWSELN
jgi:hypothetical protein